jgi:hypothetical protein
VAADAAVACAALIADVAATLLDALRLVRYRSPSSSTTTTTTMTSSSSTTTTSTARSDNGCVGSDVDIELQHVVDRIVDDDLQFFRAQFRSHATLFDDDRFVTDDGNDVSVVRSIWN